MENELQAGQKVIVYTTIIRGSAQTSYVGVVLAVGEHGFAIEGAAGKLFFPWGSVERISF
jgi:hypothetical protein